MDRHPSPFFSGLALTAILAAAGIALARVPGFSHLGALSLTLLLALALKAVVAVPAGWAGGIGFSSRQLLRVGVVLIGVRLDFALVAHAGPRIFLLAGSVVLVGLTVIPWLGRRWGLAGMLPWLIAVDTSICGASAVAAAAPTLRARDEDIALVIPLCSLIGTAGMLGLTFVQSWLPLAPATFGTLAGASLHEVAQVLAATSAVGGSLDTGTLTKLSRVVLLAPAVMTLAFVLARRESSDTHGTRPSFLHLLRSVWFVLGFFICGALNSFLARVLAPAAHANLDHSALTLATVLMAAAMAGLGLQVDFQRLRHHGLRTASVAIAAWAMILTLAAAEIHFLHL